MYNFVNVLNTTNRFRRGFMNMLSDKDEPTFLTFSIEFNFESIQQPQLGLHTSPLFNNKTGNDFDGGFSARNYLRYRQYLPEEARLTKFTEILRYLTENAPWFFQSITGLNKLWEGETNMANPNKGKDKKLTIETLESLDLSVTYLADLYRKAVYDTTYMREIIPRNLRYFQMWVWVAEFRNLRSLTESLVFQQLVRDKNIEKLGSQAMELLNGAPDYFEENSNFLRWECNFCEFDFSQSVPFKDGMNVHTPDMSTNKFDINVGHFFEKSHYSFHDIQTRGGWNKRTEQDNDFREEQNLTLDDVTGLGVSLLKAGEQLTQGASGLLKSATGRGGINLRG